MIWLIVGAVLPGMLIAWLATWIIRRRAPQWGLVDHPGQRKVHARATPLGGGLAIWLGTVIPLALGQLVLWLIMMGPEQGWTWTTQIPVPAFAERHLDGIWERSLSLWLLLGAGTVLVILGLLDDLRGLNWKTRLFVQAAVATAMVYRGWKFTAFIDVPVLTALLSALWIVGLVNSFNMLDNMDGLSGGVGGIAAAMLAGLMLLAPDPENAGPQLFVAGLLLVLLGAVLGFLWHNRPPAQIFMGDAGSYFIGFLLAMTTLLATFTGGTLPRHAILAPLCILAVPLYDTVTVVWIRLRSGKSPFEGDKNHFSHRLVELGMSKGQAVLTIYLTTVTCGCGAFLLHQVNAAGALVVLLMVGCVLTLIAVLEITARRSKRRKNA